MQIRLSIEHSFSDALAAATFLQSFAKLSASLGMPAGVDFEAPRAVTGEGGSVSYRGLVPAVGAGKTNAAAPALPAIEIPSTARPVTAADVAEADAANDTHDGAEHVETVPTATPAKRGRKPRAEKPAPADHVAIDQPALPFTAAAPVQTSTTTTAAIAATRTISANDYLSLNTAYAEADKRAEAKGLIIDDDISALLKRFGVAKVRMIPAEHIPAAIDFLNNLAK